jgi:hypothetical protein
MIESDLNPMVRPRKLSIKLLLVVPLMAVLCVGAIACGSSDPSLRTSVQSASVPHEERGEARLKREVLAARTGDVNGDGDNDGDPGYDSDDDSTRHYGQRANAAQTRVVTRIVKQYFGAAEAGDGAAGCALLYARLARLPHIGKLVPHDYDPAPPSTLARSKGCAAFLSRLFKDSRGQLSLLEIPSLKVREVRIDGIHALAILAFKTAPERYITLEREGAAWKIDGLLDSAIL